MSDSNFGIQLESWLTKVLPYSEDSILERFLLRENLYGALQNYVPFVTERVLFDHLE